jgi:integrase
MKKKGKAANGEGSIRQRPDGSWEARIAVGRNEDGKPIQRSIYGKTQAEVVKKKQELHASINSGLYVEPSAMTVGEWFDIWTSEYILYSAPKTIESYEMFTKNYIKPVLGTTKLQKLRTPAIQALYNRLLSEGGISGKTLSVKTVKNLHGVIHSALKQAFNLGYISFNPSEKCKLPKSTRPEMKPLGNLTATFMDAIKGHQYELLYLVDLSIGLRRSEIIGLSWDCIDFNRSQIRVYRQLQYIPKIKQYVFRPRKNNKILLITAPKFVMETLQKQKRRQAEWKLKVGDMWDNENNLIFTNELGFHLRHNTVCKHFKAIVKTIGIPETRFHDLRHSCATSALEIGIDVKTVQEMLGHHSAAFTLDVYGHVTDEMRHSAAAKMDIYLRGKNVL